MVISSPMVVSRSLSSGRVAALEWKCDPVEFNDRLASDASHRLSVFRFPSVRGGRWVDGRMGRGLPARRDSRRARGVSRDAAGVRVAVFRDGENVVALSGRCPHANGPLGLGWIEEGEVVCPLHRWRFRLADGRCTTMRGNPVHRFRCEVRGDEVWVEV